MDKITDYLAYAEECRRLANLATDPAHKKALLVMAQTWNELAVARDAELARKARLGAHEASPTDGSDAASEP